jgi:ABC-type phosphate/phosphonate transport system ATPase subunit
MQGTIWEDEMDMVGSERAQHDLVNAITKIDLSLQFLERHTTLSGQQHQVVSVALQGITDLKSVLLDHVDRHHVGLTIGHA